MRILHTSDWHLGKRLGDHNRIEEQKEILKEIVKISNENNVDIVLIAGDIFDTSNPSIEALELFYTSIKELSREGKRAVVVVAGNHDSPERIEVSTPIAKSCGIILIGFPETNFGQIRLTDHVNIVNSLPGYIEIKFDSYDYPARIICTPYANEIRFRQFLGNQDKEKRLRELITNNWHQISKTYMDSKGINLIIAHLFLHNTETEIPEEPEDCRPILHPGGVELILTSGIPDEVQYVALGHLHKYKNIGTENKPIIYSGSPLAYSFSESGQDKFVVIVDIEPNKTPIINKQKLNSGKNLVRIYSNEIEDVIKKLNDNKDSLVEINLYKKFITPEEKRMFYENHPSIIQINLIGNEEEGIYLLENENIQQKDINTLFKEYYRFKYGTDPTEEIMNIFKEIKSIE